MIMMARPSSSELIAGLFFSGASLAQGGDSKAPLTIERQYSPFRVSNDGPWRIEVIR